MANLGNLRTLDVVPKHANGVLQIRSAVMKMLERLRHLQLVTHIRTSGLQGGHHPPEPHLSSNVFDIISKTATVEVRFEERIALEHSNKPSSVSDLSLIDKSSIASSSSSPMPPPLQYPLLTSCYLNMTNF